MGLRDIKLKDTYWTGEHNLIYDFYIPCLSNSIIYDRAVGFFSSSILNYISEGLHNFIINGGKMRIICSTKLTQKDIDQIKEGYSIKHILQNSLGKQLEQYMIDKDMPNVKNLCWLIKNDRLEIKVCIRSFQNLSNTQTDDYLFHEKFGIFQDSEGNTVTFLGSINESINGWMYNEESFEVSYSWENVLMRRIQEKIKRFNNLWYGTAKGINTYDFPSALKEKLISIAPEEPIDSLAFNSFNKANLNKFIPRKCQLEAFEKFRNSNYICIYQMATGSGKTKAALYSFRNIMEWKFILILVPRSELVTQWESEVKIFFPDTHVIKCGSDFDKWKIKLLDIVQAKIPDKTIVISTYDSAISEFAFDKWLGIPYSQFGLICDEAHNLGANQTRKIMSLNARYRIGLTATPTRNFDEEGTEKILTFFNNNIYEFSIKDAIREKYLVEYEYKVFPCTLNKEEWSRYIKLSKDLSKIKSYSFKNNDEDSLTSKNADLLRSKYMERAEILKTANEKLRIFPNIINSIPKNIRILIYADSQEHLRKYAYILDKLKRDYFVYTGDKDSKLVRPKMLEEFKLGVRKILLAIDCLDEGIDIPACDAAVFISSSTSERQFVQRRGRVLRRNFKKRRAYIYDFIVIPDYNPNIHDELELAKQIVLKEYRRMNLIASDAINGTQVKEEIDKLLTKSGLNIFNF